jgi:hypothetical protein
MDEIARKVQVSNPYITSCGCLLPSDLRRDGLPRLTIDYKPPTNEDDQPMEPSADRWCCNECLEDHD